MDVTYLVLQSLCTARRADDSGARTRGQPRGPPGRVLFFDLGAGVYAHGKAALDTVRVDQGFGLGPSIPLFEALYRQRCIDFDRIFAFEYTPIKPSQYWRHVPVATRSRLHFYNIGVEKEPSERVNSPPGYPLRALVCTR